MLKNKKRVCLFIVEGKSDEMALAVPLRNIFKRHQGTQDIRFEITHGVITSKKGITQDKVIAAVGNAVKDFMRKYKLKKQDFAAVVQIVDTDGTFVGDEHIKIDNQSHYDKYPFYTKDDIVVQTRKGQENLVWRNHIKAKNLEKLSQNSKVMGIPYKVFYFSCNLDHVLYNIENLADDDKVQKAAEFAGKEATFKVTVKGVRSSFLPELSDEVVQKISQCKTVAEFEEFVRKSIHDFKQNQADMEKENKVLEQIVEASEIEVPQEFIDERKEQLKNNLLAQLRNAGNTFEQYLQYNGLTEELFEEYAAKDALSMLKGQAVLQEIAKAEGFSYTDEDVDQTIAAMAMSYQMPAEQLREMMGERGVAMVAEDILSKQALEFIVKEAVEA